MNGPMSRAVTSRATIAGRENCQPVGGVARWARLVGARSGSSVGVWSVAWGAVIAGAILRAWRGPRQRRPRDRSVA